MTTIRTTRAGAPALRLAVLALATLLVASLTRVGTAEGSPLRIRVTTSIQAAVDTARPGDTVVVPPGTYHETVVVSANGITIEGSHGAVIDAGGANNAVTVGFGRIARPPGAVPTCPPVSVHDFTIRGLTVRNASRNGIVLRGVDGFRISGGVYSGNGAYGVFPICSRNGVIEGNRVDGSDDSGIYVGDDDLISVVGNDVFDNTVGIEIENSTRITVRGNRATGNSVGALIVVLPGLPVPVTEDVIVESNAVRDNNRPNPVPVDEALGRVPAGTGILNVAGDGVLIRRNVVVANGTVGIGIVASPLAGLDPRMDPYPHHNRVTDNVVLNNGADPDVDRNQGAPGADLLYDGSGTDNCFGGNVFRSDFPPGVTALASC